MNRRGVVHLALVGVPASLVLGVVLIDAAINGFTVTDFLSGLIASLVLVLLKLVWDLRTDVATLLPRVDALEQEVLRLRDRMSPR